MGQVIDIIAWRAIRRSGARARGRALAAHLSWAREPESRWLWQLLSQVADADPEALQFSLDGVPVPAAVSAWLARGQARLGRSRDALVALWLAEVQWRRWRDRGRATRAWVRAAQAQGLAVEAGALPASLRAWVRAAALRDGLDEAEVLALPAPAAVAASRVRRAEQPRSLRQ